MVEMVGIEPTSRLASNEGLHVFRGGCYTTLHQACL